MTDNIYLGSTSTSQAGPNQEWRYAAEGGANLVMSYIGRDSRLQGKLLRLRKRKCCASQVGGSAIPSEVQVEFGERIITPLLGSDFVVEARIHEVNGRWLSNMAMALEESGVRPPHRSREDEIDDQVGMVVLADDMLYGDDVLTPKWGFLPSPTHLSSESKHIKQTYCRFCMHRYYKSEDRESEIKTHQGGYCPLDLYSRDRSRVERAVHALNPLRASESKGALAGNMRIFVGGRKLDTSLVNEVSCTPGVADENRRAVDSFFEAQEDGLEEVVTDFLMDSAVLEKLGCLQSSLDRLDIEGLASRIEQVHGVSLFSTDVDLSPLGPQPTQDEWVDWLASSRGSPSSGCSNEADELRSEILAYLLSATFKDCSIMMRLRRLPEGSPSEPRFERTIKAIDLDPKPIDRLGKYFQMDREIVRTWTAMLENAERPDQIRKCLV
ncbi:BZ3500_MvSof-1268-A1-R1_Chr4-4g07450 [Microbotryum saponariae]|uniref:Inositol-pentakisphosphate 2-kinase n=1 Tax=Microbotryum saponariae TaxID=289078 RepID=A0A2X0MVC3_9BASI|nr:BZ3500_MvSof-1268-A1-R1_Chr4-4g07450 [Microbotryum saponariae]SDA07111.1 BZ3501_MvSof-1269-A2-R1_Chr4-3g07158 [Microbotryum saponariae]